MYRNYQRGRHETLNVDLSDVGSDQFMVRADGLEGNAFYDMAIYSDSGRTTPLSVSDWEYYTEDERKTEQEALTGGTGETVYSQIKILNPTYQSGTIYLTFESFGTYPDGNVQGIDYLEPGDADYSFSTQRNLMTYIVYDGITADRTITVTDSGFDERSRFKVINKNTTYKVIVEDGTEEEPSWVTPGQATDFYDVDNALFWASAGWESVYSDATYAEFNVDTSEINGGVQPGGKYTGALVSVAGQSRTTNYSGTENKIAAQDAFWSTYVSALTPYWDISASTLNSGSSSWNWAEIWLWHDSK